MPGLKTGISVWSVGPAPGTARQTPLLSRQAWAVLGPLSTRPWAGMRLHVAASLSRIGVLGMRLMNQKCTIDQVVVKDTGQLRFNVPRFTVQG